MRVFGIEKNLHLLVNLLHAVLKPPPEEQVAEIELLSPFNERETPTDKRTILDIKARDQDGKQFNVEMQMIAHAHFRQRILYYWARLYQQPLEKGESYSILRPTISVCFLNDTLFPGVQDYHLMFQLIDSWHGVSLSKDLAIHLIELPKFARSVGELSDPLEKWVYFFVHGQELDTEALPPSLDTAEIRSAMKELEMLTKTEVERERYEARLKSIRDEVARQETAHQRGRAMGLEEGLAKGREEGIARGREEGIAHGTTVGRVHTLQSLLDCPLAPMEELVAMSEEQLAQLADQLERQFRK